MISRGPHKKLMYFTIVVWFVCFWMLGVWNDFEYALTVLVLLTIGMMSSYCSALYKPVKANIGFEVIA